MIAASDIADWWDEQHRQSHQALDEFVDVYPNWFGVTVATLGATSMQLGAGLVDVLRLGEGVAKGGAKGVLQDGLRLLQLAPAVGKLSRFALARVLADTGGDICTWISATKALRQVGVRAFAAVEDLAQAAGFRSVSQLNGAFVDELLPALRSLGARVTSLPAPRRLEDLVAAVKREGVVLFSVEWKMGGDDVGHTLYAFLDMLGRARIADRTGAVVSSLAELERLYPGIGQARVYGTAALVEGPRILISDGLAVMAMEVRAQLVVNPETAAQTLEVMRSNSGVVAPAASRSQLPDSSIGLGPEAARLLPPAATAGGRVPRPLGTGSWAATGPTGAQRAQLHVVRSGDWLSKLAQIYYRDNTKWPIIHAANRRVIGNDPNRILPGQRLTIPKLPRVSALRADGG